MWSSYNVPSHVNVPSIVLSIDTERNGQVKKNPVLTLFFEKMTLGLGPLPSKKTATSRGIPLFVVIF